MLEQIKKMMDKYDQDSTTSGTEDYQVCQVSTEAFATAILDNCAIAASKGRGGWHRPNECSVVYLTQLFDKAVAEGNIVKIGTYAMMLYGRGVKNIKEDVIKARLSEVSDEICRLTSAQTELEHIKAFISCDDGGERQWKSLNDSIGLIKNKINKLDCERLNLLQSLG